MLVNLASEEYFKALAGGRLKATVIQPVFEDWKNGRYKIISFFAKRPAAPWPATPSSIA